MRWPTSSQPSQVQPARHLSRDEVLARQTPPYTVEYLDQWDGTWTTHVTSPSFGFAFKKYAALDVAEKRLLNGNNKIIVYEVA